MLFEIRHRQSGRILFSFEGTSIKSAVEAAVVAKADLSNANLSGVDLRYAILHGANLSGADLRGVNLRADLRGVNLSGADLRGADLRWSDSIGADLRSADLSGADLSGADLSGADLSGADLSGADLSGAALSGTDLSGADLSGADLSGADLTAIRDDFWSVLSCQPTEVPFLREKLVTGQVNGSVYAGKCACLVGTLANACQQSYDALPNLRPDSSRPAERFFLAIREGDTPENSQLVRVVIEWIDQWTQNSSLASRV